MSEKTALELAKWLSEAYYLSEHSAEFYQIIVFLHKASRLEKEVPELEAQIAAALAEIERLKQERDQHAAAAWAASLLLGGRERLEGKAEELAQEHERLKQRCADSDAVNARYVKRVAELTDSAEDWHRVADARAEEIVKLQQRVVELEGDAELVERLKCSRCIYCDEDSPGKQKRWLVVCGYCGETPGECFIDAAKADAPLITAEESARVLAKVRAAIDAAKAGESGDESESMTAEEEAQARAKLQDEIER